MGAQLKSLNQAKAFALAMPNEEYHKHPALSNSGNNKIIDESPAHFKYYQDNPPEQTPAMFTGQVVHSAILEPEAFLDSHVAMPEIDRRTKAGKEFAEKFAIENHGKIIMGNELYHQVFGMIGSVMAHPTAKAILQKNHNELSFFGELRDVKVRCRPDILRDGCLLADLKTTDDASFKGFQRSVGNFKYHRQAAFYCDLVSQITGERYDSFSFIAVEKHPPYAVQVFVLDEASIDKGREEYEKGLEIFRACSTTNKWPSYPLEAVPINLPAWMF
jgi:hypothetical protein